MNEIISTINIAVLTLTFIAIGWCAMAGTRTLEKGEVRKAPSKGDEVRKEDLEREQAEEFLVMSRRGLETHERFLRSIEQEMQIWKNGLKQQNE